jgi:hypothetical protein
LPPFRYAPEYGTLSISLLTQGLIESHGEPQSKTIGAFSIDLKKRRAEFEAAHGKGIEHEFQQLGKELEPIFGKRIWAVFHMPKGTEANVRRAYEICKQRGKTSYAYFCGVLRNL